jgi:hypothetical protein
MGGILVRPARIEDIDWIMGQLRLFSDFFGSQLRLFPSDEYARAGIREHIERHVMLVAESERGLMGLISGIYGPHGFNPSIKCLTETFWWVTDEYRGTRAGLLLRDKFVEIGRKTANWIIFNLEAHSPVNERCLTKIGFKLQERSYLLEVV